MRVYPNKDGELWLYGGDYCFSEVLNKWFIRPPGIHVYGIKTHKIEEHSDGEITVTPSLVCSIGEIEVWHGYLTRGIFTKA